jgi:sarcosine oxidase gamma subunit
MLGAAESVSIVNADALAWCRRLLKGDSPIFAAPGQAGYPAKIGTVPAAKIGTVPLGPEAWLVFCSPPYDFYVERAEAMVELIAGLVQASPPGSVFAVEADRRLDFRSLPDPDGWDLRTYPPAVVGIYRKHT